ncbi:MAG: putative drug exporter of the superfamily [Solirubrobacterales bacterium]|nr:putative drug exporter of the superfamily [Solirubrobacterales bacterium]
MKGLAHWSIDHRRLVLVLWVALVVGVYGTSTVIGSRTSNNFSLPNTGSQQATNLLKQSDPAQAGDSDQIVLHARRGKLTSPSVRAAVQSMLDRVTRLPHVSSVTSPYGASHAASTISRDGTIGFATVNFDQDAQNVPKAAVTRVIKTAQNIRSPSLQVELGGRAIEQAQNGSLGPVTLVGLAAAVIILLLSFGSFYAMGLPIVTALFGLGTGLGLIAFASRVLDMADFSSQLALMIGLGVGIDYALFIVTRYRDAYRDNGGSITAAVETAMDTAGRAVVFAGTTVVIALLGMFALGISLLNGAAVAAAIGVLLVLAASITLLPALLTCFGRRIGSRGLRLRRRSAVASRAGFWARWVEAIQRRPWLAAVASSTLLLALAAPALGLRLGSSDAGNDATTTTTRQAYDLLARGFGKGVNGPLLVVAQVPKTHSGATAKQLATALRQTPGVTSVAAPQLNPAGDTATVLVYPTSAPQSQATTTLVKHLRNDVIPPVARATHSSVYVGGATATDVDFAAVLSSKLPLFIGIVILLSALLLLVVFRSLLIPLQAAAMNLLSFGASLGVIQAVFERGWGGSLFGAQPGPIEAFVPVMMFAIAFGLSMDYEVFLVSRIHEEWQNRRDPSAAVHEGLARTGRVITAAAAVMVAVFASFMFSGERVLELFGLGLASAILLDAIVIRLILLPAVFELLGRHSWYFPNWLDRRLPRLAIEPNHQPTTPTPELELVT